MSDERNAKWVVEHACLSVFRIASVPKLHLVSEDEGHAFVVCEAIDCDFFAWRMKR